jgi:2-dehydro-3-deoxyphosphogluconate aldolase/(4S)-4-hydroxy-2-oxoglutarate aldolase
VEIVAAVDDIQRVGRARLLPVVEIPDGTDPVALVDVLEGAGLPCIEITLRTTGALDAIATIRTVRPDVVLVAGTVVTISQVDAALDAGAGILVSPGFAPAVVDHALEREATIVPGVCTPTEIEMGPARGLETFKFFPAQAGGGVRHLAAVAVPYRGVRFIPTGGIDATNVAGYLELPNVLACGGSWMVAPRLLAEGDLVTVGRLAAEAVKVARQARPATVPAV